MEIAKMAAVKALRGEKEGDESSDTPRKSCTHTHTFHFRFHSLTPVFPNNSVNNKLIYLQINSDRNQKNLPNYNKKKNKAAGALWAYLLFFTLKSLKLVKFVPAEAPAYRLVCLYIRKFFFGLLGEKKGLLCGWSVFFDTKSNIKLYICIV